MLHLNQVRTDVWNDWPVTSANWETKLQQVTQHKNNTTRPILSLLDWTTFTLKSWSKLTTANIHTAIYRTRHQSDHRPLIRTPGGRDVSLKTARPLRSPDTNSPFLHFSGTQEGSANEMTSSFQQKLSSVHPGSAEKNVLHSMFLFVYLFGFDVRLLKQRSPPPPRIVHGCVNYWNSVFFSRLPWDRLQEVGCNSIPPL